MKKALVVLLFLLPSVFIPVFSETWAATGASLYFSPNVGVYSIGDYLTVSVKVDTNGTAVNAAEAVIVFPADKIDVISVTKTGSVFALWTEEPVFSNSAGTVRFGGGLPSPGFNGSAGNLVTITFKAKKVGSALISFSSGAVLANDGMGTNVLTDMVSGSYTFQAAEIVPEPALPTQVPEKPEVSSPTHPNPNEWYANGSPQFIWKLSPDTSGVSVILNDKAVFNPGSVSDGLIETKSFENIEDGIRYFHIKFRNQYGWGSIAHRQVLIDTTPPQVFKITVQAENPTDPQPVLIFEAADDTSGIDFYKIKIGETEIGRISSENLKSQQGYKMPPQFPGFYTVIVEAVDKAGNSMFASIDINIDSLMPPKITSYPQNLQAGDILVVGGTSSYPNAAVVVYIQMNEDPIIEGEVMTNGKGDWSYVYDKGVKNGVYAIWAASKDSRGALSNPTEKIKVVVRLSVLLRFGKIALDYLTITITLIVFIIGILLAGFYAWYRIAIWRKRVRRETKEIKESVTRSFESLKKDVEEQVEFLDEKPGLTIAERRVRDKLKESLDISEKFIQKEIKDAEKEIK